MFARLFFGIPPAPVAGLAALVLAASLTIPGPSRAGSDTKVEWLTWGFYRITAPDGKVILTNPWYTNPHSSFTLDDIPAADVILITSGHPDEIGNALDIGAKTGATIVASHEVVGQTLKQQGEPLFAPIAHNGAQIPAKLVQPGSLVTVNDVTIRAVPAAHGDGATGGPAMSYFITTSDGFTTFYSGGTDVTQDMKLWGELFRPDAAILYMSGDQDPRAFAYMAAFLSESNPDLKTVMPEHQPLEPSAGRGGADLGRELDALGVTAELIYPEPGTVYSLAK